MDKQRAIIIDTREQRPWVFPAYAAVRVGTLKQGDYALEGDDRYAIERKSLEDFIGTIFSGWERFKRELNRMDRADFVAKTIIVEADFHQICFTATENGDLLPPEHRHYNITPQAVMGRIAELGFMGVNVLFCRDAGHAAMMAYYLLMKRLEIIEREQAWGTNIKH